MFQFATAGKIIFGDGALSRVPEFAATKGKRFLVITGRAAGRSAPLLEQMDQADLAWTTFQVMHEPTTHTMAAAAEAAREAACDAVIGLGGGSVLDTAKAVAALLTNSGDLFRYLEVVGGARPLSAPPAPCIAIPTTAGTGAEVTRNAVIRVPEKGVKVSLRSPLMLPDLAVVDPRLTLTMPPEVTAATGMDALTQLAEAYVSTMANPLTDGICREGLTRAAGALPSAHTDGASIAFREQMAMASLFSGLVLANAGLGAVHGIAGPLGGMLDASHGMLCARLLPFVCEANIAALSSRAPESPALPRYRDMARIFTGSRAATAEKGPQWLHGLCSSLRVASLSQLGLAPRMLPELVNKARRSSSMQGNPIVLTEGELMDILQAAL